MNDELGLRIKDGYENAYRISLPHRTNVIIRNDGRSFHSYTKNCKRPFDDELMFAMDETAIALCEEIQNVKLAYIQSDEISTWAAPYENLESQPWFSNNLQKMSSISASVVTAKFNEIRFIKNINDQILNPNKDKYLDHKLAHFDGRCFVIPQLVEVANYFKWRSDDASRNSIQMVARSFYSHKECENKSCEELQEMIFQKGQNWDKLIPRYKRGRIVIKEYSDQDVILKNGEKITCNRGKWVVKDMDGYNFDYWFSLVNKLLEKKVDKMDSMDYLVE